jgi:hypothetical protein
MEFALVMEAVQGLVARERAALAAIGIDKSIRKRAHCGILFLREDLLKIWIVNRTAAGCARVLLYMAEGGYSL